MISLTREHVISRKKSRVKNIANDQSAKQISHNFFIGRLRAHSVRLYADVRREKKGEDNREKRRSPSTKRKNIYVFMKS